MANRENTKSVPIPTFETTSNLHINSEVNNTNASINPKAAAGLLKTFNIDNETIIKETNGVRRGVRPLEAMTEDGMPEIMAFIPNLDQVSVYSDPVAPIRFPQAEDVIKSLNFSSGSLDSTTRTSITEYYQLVSDMISGKITPEMYYAKMPGLIEKIKDYTLNETDWETLRDSILGVQRYIISFIWGDMQRISRAMDEGFKKYQKELNDWITSANEYYGDEEFIPGGAVKLGMLGRASTGLVGDEFEVQQNVRYLIDGMCVQMSPSKPSFVSGNGNLVDDYPNNKGLVWIEELSI